MSTPSPQLPLGQVIGSRYRVQSLIGRGGMGMVYSAMHELTGRRVALKLMVADDDESLVSHERFLSEARIAAAVRHPNIVDVLDMGLHGGAPFLVMELLEGRSLEDVLEVQQRLTVEQLLQWLFPIIGALAVLHEAGIVHRDVKPSNIFMSSLPRHPMRPKLLDFGLARVVSDLRLTRSGAVIGTPLYMAPEHASGLSTGPQADVWSIGVVIYEALSGVSPFNYADRSSLAIQVLAGLVRPIAQVQPELPEPICAVIGRALQRDLSRRYPDMRSLAQGLHGAALACGIRVPHDPDPIGLPEYTSWQSGVRYNATTHEHPAPSGSDSGGGVISGATQWTPPQPSAVVPAPQSSSARRWLWLVPVLLLLLLGVWWRRSRELPEPSFPGVETGRPGAAQPETDPILQKPRDSQPTVESLVVPTTSAAATVGDAAAARTAVAGPPTRRRPAGMRPARRPQLDPPADAPASARKPETSPDEVESEWK